MTKQRPILLLIAPLLILMTGWMNDNIVGIYLYRNSIRTYAPMHYWSLYDLGSKWMIGGLAAYLMMSNRYNLGYRPKWHWLVVWCTLWLMLLFEVYARFTGIFGWMGDDWTLSLYSHESGRGYSAYNMQQRLFWSLRPMVAFGLTYIVFTIIHIVLHPSSLKSKVL